MQNQWFRPFLAALLLLLNISAAISDTLNDRLVANSDTIETDLKAAQLNNEKQQLNNAAQGKPVIILPAVTPRIDTSFLSVAIDTVGNFTCGIPNGPILLFGHPIPWSSATTIRIDGVDYWNYNYNSFGTVITAPHNINNTTNEGVWDIGDIRLTENLQIVNGDSGRADTLKASYTMLNRGTVAHNVGVRIMLDTMLGANDGAPFRVPGYEITQEKEFTGANIPTYWEAFENLTSTTSAKSRGTLVNSGGALPNRIVFANWARINDTRWDFTVDPNTYVTNDSAVGMYWNPITLQPTQSITRTTFYGLSGMAVSGDGTIALSGPGTLAVANGSYTPNPFLITAYVSNISSIALTGVTTTLTLPAGLILASGSLTQTIGTVAVGDSQQASWNVKATGSATGVLTFSAKVQGTNFAAHSVNETVTVPVLTIPTQTLLTATPSPSAINQNVTFTAKVTATTIPTGTVTFKVDGLTKAATSLSNGQTTYATNTLAFGNHIVRAEYAGNTTWEASSAQLTQIVSSGPDFVISSLGVTPNFSAIGQAVTVRIVVKNQGAVAGAGGTLSLWLDKVDTAACNAVSDKAVSIGTLAAGASKAFIFSALTSTNAGIKVLRVFADSACGLTETNDGNNQVVRNYAVGMPDLTVTSITLTPATPAIGSTFSAQVVVKNQGPVNLGNTSFLDLWLNQATNQGCGAGSDVWSEIDALAAGASQTFTFTGLTAGTVGNKTLRAFADSWCERVDANRSNNQFTKAYTVQ